MWTDIQVKQDKIQQDYQGKLETIIEECAQLKFEKISQIKLQFKKEDTEDQQADRDRQIEEIKAEMEDLKQQRIDEAKQRLQSDKMLVQEEKNRLLEDAKQRLIKSRPVSKAGSYAGDGLGEFVSGSPGLLRLSGGKLGRGGPGFMGGSISARTTPKNRPGLISASPGLRM